MGHALLVGGGPVDLTQLQAEVAKQPDLIMARRPGWSLPQ